MKNYLKAFILFGCTMKNELHKDLQVKILILHYIWHLIFYALFQSIQCFIKLYKKSGSLRQVIYGLNQSGVLIREDLIINSIVLQRVSFPLVLFNEYLAGTIYNETGYSLLNFIHIKIRQILCSNFGFGP